MKLKTCTGLVLVGLFFSGIGTAFADEVYTAKLIRKRGLSKDFVHLDLRIRERATEEQAAALRKILAEQGTDALMDALRKGDYGEARVTGGLPRRIGWVRVYPGQNGSQVIIVTERPLYFPGEEPEGETSGAVGIITLEMNDRGQGRGRLAEAVKIDITEEGVLRVEAARPATIEMEDVRREQ